MSTILTHVAADNGNVLIVSDEEATLIRLAINHYAVSSMSFPSFHQTKEYDKCRQIESTIREAGF